MPRPKPPPTPSASTDLPAKERIDMESAFTLPPPAMNQKPPPRPSPPVSPTDKPLGSSLARKRTLSGSHKTKEDSNAMQYDLPPPPSRARKIIQMKPKTGSASSTSPEEDPPSPAQPAKPTATGSKRKQPSATSAAGRKIARKTAHSIIERRRRSKMNEEFGVLKDMIPACEGVEMHKLAILQAGIEYLRYLEDCIKQMKAEKEHDHKQHDAEDESVEDEEDDEIEDLPEPIRPPPHVSVQDRYRKASNATDSSSNASPNILPQSSRYQVQPPQRTILPSISSFTNSPNPRPASSTPTPTLLSPAFNAIHFSPDMSRTATNSTQNTSSGGMHISQSQPSPNILPLPQAMMALDRMGNVSPMSEGRAEATATAALMMLTNDRRTTADGGQGQTIGQGERARAKGMSVRDLLTS